MRIVSRRGFMFSRACSASLFIWSATALVARLAPVPPPTAKAPAKPGDTITLTPFEVLADPRDTYDATNTNSVTGTNTALNKTPLDAKVFNREVMDELGVVDMTEML